MRRDRDPVDSNEQALREQLAAEHAPHRIRRRLDQDRRPDYLPDFIYGAIDGTVTTFAVVSGVAGADLSSSIVIVLGLANLVGDGFSMAASNYSGTRTEQQLVQRARRQESQHIDVYPEGEREEIRQIFASKGFSGESLEQVVDVICADRERWINVMLTEERGLSLTPKSPLSAGAMTMAAFMLVGSIPLLPFAAVLLTGNNLESSFLLSTLLTAVAFLIVGAVKSRFVEQHWLPSGLETLGLGGAAAGLAYAVGFALRGII